MAQRARRTEGSCGREGPEDGREGGFLVRERVSAVAFFCSGLVSARGPADQQLFGNNASLISCPIVNAHGF